MESLWQIDKIRKGRLPIYQYFYRKVQSPPENSVVYGLYTKLCLKSRASRIMWN